MENLPPEILDTIVDVVSDCPAPTKSLLSCMLVDRSFWRARVHLFSHIQIMVSQTRRNDLLKEILEYQAPGYPSLISCVKSITIEGSGVTDDRTIPAIVGLLASPSSALQEVGLNFYGCPFPPPDGHINLYQSLRALLSATNVQRLKLRQVEIFPMTFLQTSTIQSLKLDNAFVHGGSECGLPDHGQVQAPPHAPAHPSTQLRHFNFTLPSSASFPQALIPDSSPSMSSNLESMEVRLGEADSNCGWNTPHLSTILSHCRHSLKNLEFFIASDDDNPSASCLPSLASLRQLQQLSYIIFTSGSQPRSPMFRWNLVFHSLASMEMAPRSLSRLAIHFSASGCTYEWTRWRCEGLDEDESSFGRKALFKMLSSTRFVYVEKVEIVLHLCGTGATTADIPCLLDFPDKTQHGPLFEITVLRDEQLPDTGYVAHYLDNIEVICGFQLFD